MEELAKLSLKNFLKNYIESPGRCERVTGVIWAYENSVEFRIVGEISLIYLGKRRDDNLPYISVSEKLYSEKVVGSDSLGVKKWEPITLSEILGSDPIQKSPERNLELFGKLLAFYHLVCELIKEKVTLQSEGKILKPKEVYG